MSDGTVNVGSAQSGLCCIAGLGNPGIRYARTPHNIGFWVLDEVAERSGIRISKTESGALIGTGKVQDRDVVLVKPQTFMNNSGEPLASVLRFRKLAPEDLIVVHDELDLPWTALRIKIGGSAAGHNGIKSIISSLKTDCFTRVRVGIRPDHKIVDAADYVLAPLERELKVDEEEIVSYTANAIESIVAEGANKAMTKFNRRARGNKEEEE
jgi:PTH1 family peptidyl-tRNA hydrolase